MEVTKSYTDVVNSIKIKGVKIRKIIFERHDEENIVVSAVGDLSEYETWIKGEMLAIRTTDNYERLNIIADNAPVVDLLTLTLPFSFRGDISVRAVDSYFEFNEEDDARINSICLEGAQLTANLNNLESSIRVNAAKSEIEGWKLRGEFVAKGASNTLILNEPSTLRASMNGADNAVSVIADTPINYHINLAGILSTVRHHGKTISSKFGPLRYNPPADQSLPSLTIDGKGVNTRVILA